jgi:hypothetical protein
MEYKGNGRATFDFRGLKDGRFVSRHIREVDVQAPVPPPIPDPPAPTPAPGPTPSTPADSWKRPKLVPFQIFKVERSVAKFVSQLDPGTKLVNTELDELTPEIAREAARLGVDLVAYFCANWEVYRKDIADYPKEGIGATMGDWPDEKWGNFTLDSVQEFLKKRIDRAAALRIVNPDGTVSGVVAIEMDNTDIYDQGNNPGFRVTKEQTAAALQRLAAYAHEKGLAVYLKNSGNVANLLKHSFDGVFNESCIKYNECAEFDPMIDLGKPLYGVMYCQCGKHPGAIIQLKPECSSSHYFHRNYKICA